MKSLFETSHVFTAVFLVFAIVLAIFSRKQEE